ncbi:MAG: glycosyltransferase [Caldilineaceae bacterium]|nr:glycosyltransferase [Caldilineaceae bacterium]MCB0142712.1 glycosyltransferase [Caldilineaceae bacterium]
MKILYIIPTFQHPKVRGSDRHYHFVRELAQRHRITLLSLQRVDQIAPEAVQEISAWVDELITFKVERSAATGVTQLLTKVPVVGKTVAEQKAVRDSVEQMRRTFRQLTREGNFDLVLFHGKDCYPVIDGWRDLPIVIDFCDATSLRVRTKMLHVSLPQKALLGLRYRQVRSVEKKMIQATPHLAFISQRDRTAVLGDNSHAAVIPNGIDLDYWTRRTHSPEPKTLIFTGVMDYSPNEDAALHLIDNILPHLRKEVPDVRVLIAGRSPTPALQERARLHKEVVVTGFVEDMRDYLEQAAVFVAPLRYASGMQNKLQEALAMQVPVVTTSVAANGLRVKDGQKLPLYVADAPESFAQRVVELLNRPDEQTRLATEGRQYAEAHFSWTRSATQLEEMCIRAAGYGSFSPASGALLPTTS